MATATEQPHATPVKASRPPRAGRGRFVLLLVLTGIAALAWFWKPLTGNATAAASYGAHTACACRYVAGRSLDACRSDFEDGMGALRLSEDAEARSVTAHFPLLSSQTATFRPGEGCVLEPWRAR